jgi:hypothetical protein
MMKGSSKRAGQNGAHVETLILGHPSNPSNLVDNKEDNIEIKSCLKKHTVVQKSGKYSTRTGQFKINYEQHRHLVETGGTYIFSVLDVDMGHIVSQISISAKDVERRFHILDRVLTKHHYYSLNWKKVIDDVHQH